MSLFCGTEVKRVESFSVFVSDLGRPVEGSVLVLSAGCKTCSYVYIEEEWSDSVKLNPKC